MKKQIRSFFRRAGIARDPRRLQARLVLAARVLMFLIVVLTQAAPVSAQTPDDAAGQIVAIFKKLGLSFIQVAYSLMFVVFAVGSVKNGLAAQAAQQFRLAHRVSDELLNMAGGVIIFVIGLMTLPLVNWIIAQLSGMYTSNLDFTIPGFVPPSPAATQPPVN